MKKALVTGISGQDGAYLAKLLLQNGYQVCGTSRDAQMSSFRNLDRLGIRREVQLASVALNDFRSVLQVLFKVQPDEIYNLGGQSSVSLSFDQPVETQDSIYLGTLNLLEAIRFTGRPIRLYNASSSECFGDLGGERATEETAYHIFACSGILFNHESPLRPERFVTQKIVQSACRIAQGHQEKLQLGNIEIQRDWGWAPEYVEAMYRMLQQEDPEDFVIATGQTRKLQDFVAAAFDAVGLDWRDHTRIDQTLFRPTEIMIGRGDASKAADKLGWQPKYKMDDVVRMMAQAASEGGK
jgi:GDPmannose 4,6-dehydratase